jgi:Na+-transporting methylmalonyl-CoA/oxaloacetate decarboxylase beta subunit
MKKEILVDEREYTPKSCSLFSIIVVIFHHILICSLISFQVYGILIETDLIQNYFSIGDQQRIWLIISFFLGMNVSTPIAEYILRAFTNTQIVFSLTIFYSLLSFIQGCISDVYLFTFIRFIIKY